MLSEVPVETVAAGESIEFRFSGALSMFMLVVRRDDEVVWELFAVEGKRQEVVEGSISITALLEATPELLEMVDGAEENFIARVREGPPLTTPILYVRYGEVPRGYRQEVPARELTAGRYSFAAMFAQGHASGEFDVPAA